MRSRSRTFAAEFDPQPFHLSEEGAEGTLFGSLAASGWHTAALTMRMLVESVPLADGLIGAELQLGWPKPTRPGMTLQVFSEIVEIKPSRSKPNMAIVTMRNETRDEKGEAAAGLRGEDAGVQAARGLSRTPLLADEQDRRGHVAVEFELEMDAIAREEGPPIEIQIVRVPTGVEIHAFKAAGSESQHPVQPFDVLPSIDTVAAVGDRLPIGADVILGRVNRDAAWLQQPHAVQDKVQPVVEGSDMLERARTPREIEFLRR